MNSAGRVIRVTCNVELSYYSVHCLGQFISALYTCKYTVDVKEQTLDDYTAILFQYTL